MLLIKEAEAWRALLQLNSSALTSGQRTLAVLSHTEALNPSENEDASDQREAAYISNLSQLIASSDSLIYEAVKLRGLRKAKQTTEVAALRELFKTHSNEILATGEALCRNSALQMASLSNEIRKRSQQLKLQIQQARGLLAVLNESKCLKNGPDDATIVIGYKQGDGEALVRPVEDVLRRVCELGGGLTDEAVCDALFATGEKEAGAPSRIFARRSGVRVQGEAARSAVDGSLEKEVT